MSNDVLILDHAPLHRQIRSINIIDWPMASSANSCTARACEWKAGFVLSEAGVVCHHQQTAADNEEGDYGNRRVTDGREGIGRVNIAVGVKCVDTREEEHL